MNLALTCSTLHTAFVEATPHKLDAEIAALRTKLEEVYKSKFAVCSDCSLVCSIENKQFNKHQLARYCSDCAAVLCQGCSYWCTMCRARFCNNYPRFHHCPVCWNRCCEACAPQCPECHEIYCLGCNQVTDLVACVDCSQEVCRACRQKCDECTGWYCIKHTDHTCF